MDDKNELIKKLKILEQEHRDLDQILIQLQEKKTVDFLQIQRIKKRKLMILVNQNISSPNIIYYMIYIIKLFLINFKNNIII